VSDAAAERWERVREALLGALELPEAERGARLERLRAADPELGLEVAGLLRHAAESGDFLETPALARLGGAAPPGAPERIGPWRLERQIGRGGMGVVWRARRDDGAFEQTVAIKLVRPELASELLRRRLVSEMRILAALGHESIARLLDGGVTPEGVPYLALEYVDGEPIDHHCDRHALPLAGRLRLFLEVAGAVEFAHRRLVLHRDLKSANVLVDARGRPKLLDFGIAKLLSGGPEAEQWTALGFERPLTPEWASPEQLRGAELTTASDVYSLGVLLHVLLTGERPHRFSGQRPDAFAREIEESGEARLRGLARRRLAPGVEARALKSDLERIVAKALAGEPAERYGTAAALAAEVERFLAGRPVEAHAPSFGYRARKYVARHRAGAAAAAVALLSLLAATAVSLRQARIATAERARAERRFAEVRALANRFLFEFEESIRDLPGATPARERIVSTARDYLDRLAAEAGDDAGLLAELAQASLALGDLEGHPRKANLGRPGDAQKSYERARALGRRLVELAPASVLGHAHVGTGELRLSDLALDRGDLAAVDRHAAAAVAAFDRALAAGGADRAHARSRAQALQRLGSAALARGEYGEAEAALREYREACLAALAADPAGREATRDALVAAILLGDVHDERGRPEEALPIFREALDRAEARVRAFPGAEAERDRSVALQRVIIALRKLDRHEEALPLARAALDGAEAAFAADPENALAERDLAESVADVGRELGALGRWPEALAEFERSRALFERLAGRDPESAEIRAYLASALQLEAGARAGTGDGAGAERAALGGIRIEGELLAASPDDARLAEHLAASLRTLSRWRLARGAAAAARADLERAVELEERLTARAGRSAERDAGLAAALWLRGRARGPAEHAAACADFARAGALAARLDARALAAEELALEALARARTGC
jgi:non-specific serine/threonine protein kinase/serine/threonine-protein kinase